LPWTASIYEGPSPNLLNRVINLGDDSLASAEFWAEAGKKYWIGVYSTTSSSARGPYYFSLLPTPSNDAWEAAEALPADGGRNRGYTFLATEDQRQPLFGTETRKATVWYRWSPAESTITTLPLKIVPTVDSAIFTGTDLTHLTPVNVLDKVRFNSELRVRFSATAGATYWIGVAAQVEPDRSFQPPQRGWFDLALGIGDLPLLVRPAEEVITLGPDFELNVPDDSLASVTFVLGQASPVDSLPLTLTASPFSHSVSNLPEGRYTLFALGTTSNNLPQLSCSWRFRIAPTNDAFTEAGLVRSLPVTWIGSVIGASDELNESSLEGQSAPGSRWWRWTAQQGGTVVISGAGLIGVFVGEALTLLIPIRSSAEELPIRFEATVGQTYYFTVVPQWHYGTEHERTSDPNFYLTVAWLPPNDEFDRRTTVAGTELDLVAHHSGATGEPREPNFTPWTALRSVWFAWTAPADGWLELQDPSGDDSHQAGVFTGSELDELVLIGSARNGAEPIQLRFAGGVTYVISLNESKYSEPTEAATWRLRWLPLLENDFFAQRRKLLGNELDVSASNLGATRETGEPERRLPEGNLKVEYTIWFSWTAPASGWARLRRTSEDPPIYAEVFTGDSLGWLKSLWTETESFNPLDEFDFLVEAGRSYQVSVGSAADWTGTFQLHLSGPARPENNAFVHAIRLPSDVESINGTVRNATVEPDEAIETPSENGTAWYRWISPGRGLAHFFDSQLSLSAWQGNSVANLDRTRQGSGPQFRTETGQEYYLRVDGTNLNPFSVPFTFSLSRPNDDFAQATPLTGAEALAEGSVLGATFETGELGEPNVWWRWTAPQTGSLRVELLTDHQLSLIRGPSATEHLILRQFLYYGDRRPVPVLGGATYHLRAGSYGDPSIRFRLRFTPTPPPELSRVRRQDGQWRIPIAGTLGQLIEMERPSTCTTGVR